MQNKYYNQVHCNNFGILKNNIKVAQINVESLTRAKADILSKIFTDIYVLVIQQIHVPKKETICFKIIGFYMINYIGEKNGGLSIYINQKKYSHHNIQRMVDNDYVVSVRINN